MMVGVTGHQDLPPQGLSLIEARVEQVLRRYADGLTGISSLAAGADQLFADLVLRSRGSLHVIVPCAGYESAFENGESLEHFRSLLRRAGTIETLNYHRPSQEAFLAAGRRVVDLSEVLVAVWDGKAPRGSGGTADIVRHARDRKIQIIVIWPEGINR